MKAIYIQELALQYFPNSTPRSAITQLKRWIDLNTELQARLAELKRQRSLTPKQHEAIIYYLGSPD